MVPKPKHLPPAAATPAHAATQSTRAVRETPERLAQEQPAPATRVRALMARETPERPDREPCSSQTALPNNAQAPNSPVVPAIQAPLALALTAQVTQITLAPAIRAATPARTAAAPALPAPVRLAAMVRATPASNGQTPWIRALGPVTGMLPAPTVPANHVPALRQARWNVQAPQSKQPKRRQR